MDTRKNFESDEFAKAWDEHQSKTEDVLRTRMLHPFMEKTIGTLDGKIVLETGCGNGQFIPHLLNSHPKELHAFDISPGLVHIAQERYPQAHYKVADITQPWPYEAASFDVVNCMNVLMEVPNVGAAAEQASRAIKSKGVMYVVTVHPLYNLFVNDVQANEGTPIERLRRYTKEEHLHVNTIPGYDQFIVYRRPLAQYVNAFANAGFSILEMQEIPVQESAAVNEKYKQRLGVPVFVCYKLQKR